jgi:hypothetical protein
VDLDLELDLGDSEDLDQDLEDQVVPVMELDLGESEDLDQDLEDYMVVVNFHHYIALDFSIYN